MHQRDQAETIKVLAVPCLFPMLWPGRKLASRMQARPLMQPTRHRHQLWQRKEQSALSGCLPMELSELLSVIFLIGHVSSCNGMLHVLFAGSGSFYLVCAITRMRVRCDDGTGTSPRSAESLCISTASRYTSGCNHMHAYNAHVKHTTLPAFVSTMQADRCPQGHQPQAA